MFKYCSIHPRNHTKQVPHIDGLAHAVLDPCHCAIQIHINTYQTVLAAPLDKLVWFRHQLHQESQSASECVGFLENDEIYFENVTAAMIFYSIKTRHTREDASQGCAARRDAGVEAASTQAVRYSSITPAVANTCLPDASLTALALIPAYTQVFAITHQCVCAQGGRSTSGQMEAGRDICKELTMEVNKTHKFIQSWRQSRNSKEWVRRGRQCLYMHTACM